jgi:hypothetical protein
MEGKWPLRFSAVFFSSSDVPYLRKSRHLHCQCIILQLLQVWREIGDLPHPAVFRPLKDIASPTPHRCPAIEAISITPSRIMVSKVRNVGMMLLKWNSGLTTELLL